jgi:nucleotide-binding universal stress UspA family protein
MPTPEVLVPLDGSSLAHAAVAHAAEIARRIGGSLHLVRVHVPLGLTVVPTDAVVSIPDPVIDTELRADAEEWLAQRAMTINQLNDVPVTIEVRVGIPEAEIVLAAAERRPRLIVCTTRGRGVGVTRLIGSVADSVMRHASCPVLAMSPKAVRRDVHVRKVLVLLDGSEASASIMSHAEWLAHSFGAALDCLRLTPSPKKPLVGILNHINCTQPDVVALSTHGRSISRAFFGSIADDMVRRCDRPTLVFRPRNLDWELPEDGLAPAASARWSGVASR